MTSRIVWQEAVGGPETLEVKEREIPEPGPGEVRVRVTAASLNPVDWKIAEVPGLGEAFGVTFPTGYGNDLAGTVDAVGEGVAEFAVGDRVFGGKRGEALADYVVLPATALTATPDAITDAQAASIPIAGRTAVAAIDALHLTGDDTVLVGGAAGGVGGFAVQRALAQGATVIGTASERNHPWLTSLGVVPVTYGEGLAERVATIAPDGITAAADLQGTETAEAALALGVAPSRITAIAAGPNAPEGVIATGGAQAPDTASAEIAAGLADGSIQLEIQEFPLEKLTDAIELVRGGHVRGKVVVTLV